MRSSSFPNFFIVGAARSGTTTLWQQLKKHPQVFMPQDELHKEPAFFSEKKGSARGLEGYLDLFRDAKAEQIRIGEASTAYLTDSGSAQRIYHFNSQSKIIIILRNPADRAYSLYRWMTQDGYEYAESFEEALELEQPRTGKHIPNWLQPEYFWNYMYYKSGLYSTQVRRYLDLFGDNVLVVNFDDFKNDFQLNYNNICEFLGIEKIEFSAEKHNESKMIYSPCLQFVLRKVTNSLIIHQGNSRFFNKRLTGKFLSSYFQNSLNLFLKTGKMINPFYSLHIFKRFRRETAKADFKYCPLERKEDRDFLLRLGTETGKPPRIKEDTRTNLISSYQEDIARLEKILHCSFKRWN